MTRDEDVAQQQPGPPSSEDLEDWEREAEPIARSVFDLLRHASRADQRFVLVAVRGQLIDMPSERAQLALNALNLCLADEGRLSRPIYDRWRAKQAKPAEYPSSQYIRNTFKGSWARAMEVAGSVVIGEAISRRLLGRRKPFTRQDVIDCVVAYAATGGKLTFDQYRDWARAEMHNPQRKLPRLIRSMDRIIELFGSWGQLLAAAGLIDENGRGPNGRQLRSPVGRRGQYTPKILRRWLRKASAAGDGRAIGGDEYDAWVNERRAANRRRGHHIAIPGSDAFRRRFGSWPDALYAAGLIDQFELLARRGRRGGRMTEEQIIDWLAQALADDGPQLSEAAYDRWRNAYIERTAPDTEIGLRTDEKPPSNALIRQRLGSWAGACQRARQIPQQSSISGKSKGAEEQSDDA